MSDPKDKEPDDAQENDLTAEIRRGRKFGLAEAVGRAAGGSLKGASPVAQTRQLAQQIEEILDHQLPDNEGSLRRTMVAQLADNSPLLDRHLGDPHGALLDYLGSILDTPPNLEAFVRQVDARWGRDYDERPHFESPERPANYHDPYTHASVRLVLDQLRLALSS